VKKNEQLLCFNTYPSLSSSSIGLFLGMGGKAIKASYDEVQAD
jgi:hypothetical protein